MSGDSPHKHPALHGESRETFEGNRFGDEALQRVHGQLMREKEEPSENFSYPPLVLIFVFMILAFWAGVYIAEYSGEFSPFVYDEHGEMMAKNLGPLPPPDPLKLGKGVFVRNCVACHQSDGKGMAGVFPPVANSDWVRDHPERLIKVVLGGLQGPVEVNGNAYNNAMMGLGGAIDDQGIAAVLTYIRTAEEFGNDSYPVTPEMVARVRAEYGARSEAWTAAELEQIHGPVTGRWSPPAETVSDEAPSEEEAAPAETPQA